MTNTTNKARALVLAALMVFSVFAGSVAFAGSAAAAAGNGQIAIDQRAIDIGQESDTQTFSFDYEQESGDETITIDVSETLDNGVEITSASVNGEPVEVDNGEITLDASDAQATNDVVLDLDLSDASTDSRVTHVISDSESGEEIEVQYKLFEASDTSFTDGDSGGTIQVGEPVTLVTSDGSEQGIEIFRVDDSNDGDYTPVDTLHTAPGDRITYDTSDLEAGEDYKIAFDGESASSATITLQTRDLGLSAELVDNTVQTDESVEVSAESNDPQGAYTAVLLDSDGDEVDGTEVTGTFTGSGDADIAIDAPETTGNYTVEVTHDDTGVSVETDEVQVEEAGDEDIAVANDSVTDQQGDIAAITVELDETDTGSVVIGDYEDDSYQANISVEDGDDDGEVTVLFNTYLAGMSTGSDYSASDVVSAEGDDDTATLENFDSEQQDLDDLLDSGEYDISVSTSPITEGDASTALNNEDDLSTLILEERSTDEMNLWRASSDTIEEIQDEDAEDQVSAVDDAVSNDGLTETDMVAGSDDGADQLVFQTSASGLEGLLDAAGADGDSVSEQLAAATSSGQVALSIEQTEATTGNNQDPKEVDVTSDSLSVVSDSDENVYYIVFDPSAASFVEDGEFEDGDAYEAELSIADGRLLELDDEDVDGDGLASSSDDYDSVNATFDYEAAEGSFDDPTNVTASENVSIEGETNIAPGSEVNVRIRSGDNTEPRFIETITATVQADGTLEATGFDLSDNAAGDTFTVTGTGTFAAFEEADGNIVESVGTSTPGTDDGTPTTDDGTPTDTATPDDGTPTDTATPDGNGDDSTPTETTTPGFTAVLALIALIGAALVAVRRD
ncbi:PGF-CTERM sorting domain-containing protein [Halorarum salinum]|uniref:PGF-CTERM sorting domain-containing protein n=2 Tax=Halorarum salinum TaxID=2743089 RepID=A0A7D5LDU1_9EURY|nr:PGF-CTERM sorting domain-containing protein [Halobaculum salinum]